MTTRSIQAAAQVVALGGMLAAGLLAGGNAAAATMLDVAPGGAGTFASAPIGSQAAFASGFRLSASFTNVAIEALIGSFTDPYPAGAAFLTTAIGLGTTAASQLAQTALTFPTISTPSAYTTVFSGLALGPGDYYLVVRTPTQLANADPVGYFLGDVVSTAADVTFLGDFARVPPAAYAPATNFVPYSISNLRIRITGDRVPDAVVPAPGASALLVGLVIALAARRQRARYTT